ncbi:hypothetical protein COCVIDRAFT_102406, partial [Bipolaris victoriae FI3]
GVGKLAASWHTWSGYTEWIVASKRASFPSSSSPLLDSQGLSLLIFIQYEMVFLYSQSVPPIGGLPCCSFATQPYPTSEVIVSCTFFSRLPVVAR